MKSAFLLRLVTGFSVALTAVGYLFKFNHWNGADLLLFTGMILTLLVGTGLLLAAMRPPQAAAGARYCLAAGLTLLTLGMVCAFTYWLPARPLILAGLAAAAVAVGWLGARPASVSAQV